MRHVPALDGVRGIAIILVLLHHAWVPQLGGAVLPGAGWAGVDLFFVLSGYLITTRLLESKGRPHFFRNFYARRVLRILPLYYVAVLLLVLSGTIVLTQAWYWLHGVNILMSIATIPFPPSHFWSLAVEEQFYLVWPFCVWALSERAFHRLAWMVVIGAAAARAVFWAMHFAGLVPLDPTWTAVLTPFRGDALAMGALLAIAARHDQWSERFRRAAPVVGLASVAVILALTARHGMYANAIWDVQVFGYSANAAGAAVLIRYAESSRSRLLSTPLLRAFGKYSYCLYIVHPFVIRAFTDHGLAPHRPLVGAGFFLVITAVSFMVSWISWRVVERPALSLKRYFV